jgi:demethylmenaquinone methyltransferase/2-methoxy-6-polyprenyl-1,4-benzoquinol methylase
MPERARPGNAVPADEVASMFDRIVPIYDRMNTLMTLGLDARWRRAAARATRLEPGMSAVDVACGSGALTRLLGTAVAPGGSVIGVDLSPGMVRRARRRPAPGVSYVTGDAMSLPLQAASVDAATIAFGLRNVPDYERCLAEMARVTNGRGQVVVLELATPVGRLGRALAATWFGRGIPLLGRLAGGGSAYAYLPRSVDRYPPPDEISTLMRRVGLRDVRWRRLAPGLVTLHTGRSA